MPYRESAIDTKVRKFLEATTSRQQFGQASDDAVWDGATGCTHTCFQLIAYLWTGKLYTLNAINSMAGMPYKARGSNGQPRGMRTDEAARLVKRLKLPYQLIFGASMTTIRNVYLGRGPVLISTRYGSQPDWRGYTYHGVKADGSPNGFAMKAGRTQLTGFESGRHAVLLGLQRQLYDSNGKAVRSEILQRDPNHGSPARPEKPAYDIINIGQSAKEYDDYERTGVRKFAWVPTRSLPA